MVEHWLNIEPVGISRMFITGTIPGNDEFEVELTESQRKMVGAFLNEQQNELQNFLMGLVT